jgi:sensor histidine kinase YesM
VVDYYHKFKYFYKGEKLVLHDRQDLKDEMPDILDVPKSNEHEIAVNCIVIIYASTRKKINLARFGIQLFLWLILAFFLLYFIYDEHAPFLQQFVATLVVIGFTARPSYYSTKVLVTNLLYQKRIRRFIVALVITELANSVFTYFLAGIIYFELSGKSIFTNILIIQYIFSFFFVFNCIAITVSSAVQIIVDRFGMEKQLHAVEGEKVSTELAFLRAQINPHFLFNVLNTIYFQNRLSILKKSS